MVNKLKQTLEEHKEEYLQYLKDLIACDTQDLGHGIAGGREKSGQEYMTRCRKQSFRNAMINTVKEI